MRWKMRNLQNPARLPFNKNYKVSYEKYEIFNNWPKTPPIKYFHIYGPSSFYEFFMIDTQLLFMAKLLFLLTVEC